MGPYMLWIVIMSIEASTKLFQAIEWYALNVFTIKVHCVNVNSMKWSPLVWDWAGIPSAKKPIKSWRGASSLSGL